MTYDVDGMVGSLESDNGASTGVEGTPSGGQAGNINGQDGTISTGNPAPATQTQAQMFKYKALGREIEEPIDTILQRASQGYDYAQKMQEFKSQQDQFATQQQDAKTLQGKWEQYENYSKENPEWADHVRSSWESRGTFGNAQQPEAGGETSSLPPEFQKKMNQFDEFMTNMNQERQLNAEAKEDTILGESIATVQKEYPDIDLTYSDPTTGMTREMAVMQHAKQNSIHSFKAAFRDLYFDQIVARQVTAAKEASVKEIQERNKRGFISDSDTSMINRSSFNSNNSNTKMSYQQLAQHGAEELGIIQRR